MSHTTVDEEAAGRAALYALGALEGDEAREFEEHLAAGCAACEAGLREFETVAADLGLAAPEAAPPAGVRARLLALPAYFVLANVACVLAFYKFLRGERYARWETARGGDGA